MSLVCLLWHRPNQCLDQIWLSRGWLHKCQNNQHWNWQSKNIDKSWSTRHLSQRKLLSSHLDDWNHLSMKMILHFHGNRNIQRHCHLYIFFQHILWNWRIPLKTSSQFNGTHLNTGENFQVVTTHAGKEKNLKCQNLQLMSYSQKPQLG